MSTPNEIQTVKCPNWDSFITEIRTPRSTGLRLFRGHKSASWKLESKLERWLRATVENHPSAKSDRAVIARLLSILETGTRNKMQHHATGLPGHALDVNWLPYWDELGRHHGLITRLLDWSRSPFVAAYFAAIDLACDAGDFRTHGYTSKTLTFKNDDPFVVWEFAVPNELMDSEQRDFQLVTGRHEAAHRQKAQQGVFTRLNTSDYLDLEGFLLAKGLSHHLVRFEIPGFTAVRAVRDLELMNISLATLYPDLDGAAMQSNMDATREALTDLETGRTS